MSPSIALSLNSLKDASKSYGSKPYWFGLGFIQLKLNDVSRVHYWCPWIPAPEREEIHDHRYNFKSTVVAGVLHFELYEPTPMQRDHVFTHELFQTDCAPGHEGNKDPKAYPVTLEHRGTYDVHAGSSYWFSEKQFHTTEGTRFAITYLEREEKTKQFANVIKPKGAPVSCPFAKTLPEDECWSYIEQAIAAAYFLKDSHG